jgi:protein phosphatase
VVAAVVLALIVGGAIGTYAWALQHWFVGTTGSGEDEMVGVFRGLNTSIVGLDLYRLDEETPLAVSDLTSAARSRVHRGITADDADDADRILDALRDQRLPLCPAIGVTPSPSASPAPTGSAAPSSAPGTDSTTAGPRRTAESTPAGRTLVPGRTGAGTGDAPSTPATSSSPASPSRVLEPGVDCREAR